VNDLHDDDDDHNNDDDDGTSNNPAQPAKASSISFHSMMAKRHRFGFDLKLVSTLLFLLFFKPMFLC